MDWGEFEEFEAALKRVCCEGLTPVGLDRWDDVENPEDCEITLATRGSWTGEPNGGCGCG